MSKYVTKEQLEGIKIDINNLKAEKKEAELLKAAGQNVDQLIAEIDEAIAKAQQFYDVYSKVVK